MMSVSHSRLKVIQPVTMYPPRSQANRVHPLDQAGNEPRLGSYRLIRALSAGGMARVYEGRLDSLAGVSTRVAIKVIHPEHANDQAFQDLFIAEARISARLEHQNLVRIQAFNRDGELYYLVMELIDGLTLRRIMSLCRRHNVHLPTSLIAELGRQACEGLEYAHQIRGEDGQRVGLVHRDIKPSNLMLNTQGVLKVLDFGISYADGTEVGSGVKGTWGYMALEQAENRKVGPSSDVYGLAAVLYELATLEPLFEEKDNQKLRGMMLNDDAARRATGLMTGPYADLGAVLIRALQRDPAARFPTCGAMGRALGRLVREPVTVREELVQLLQTFRAMEEGPRSSATNLSGSSKSSASTPSISTPPVPGALASGEVRSGSLHDASSDRSAGGTLRKRRSHPSWLAFLGVGFVMSVVGGASAAALVDWLHNREDLAGGAAAAPVAAQIADHGAPSQEMGSLSISATPPARVFMDAKYLQDTPFTGLPVTPGMHTVEVVAPDGRRKGFQVLVEAGREERRSWNFEQNRWQ